MAFGLGGLVVLAGQFDQLGLYCLPIRRDGVGGDLSENLVPQRALVPAFRPPEPVEEPVQFCLAVARAGSIPTAFRAFAFGVVPIRAAFGVERQLDQTQAEHQVANHLGLVERAGEGAELDPVLSAGQVRQVQEVVAVRFAALLGTRRRPHRPSLARGHRQATHPCGARRIRVGAGSAGGNVRENVKSRLRRSGQEIGRSELKNCRRNGERK